VQFTDSVAHVKTEAFIAGTSTNGEKSGPVAARARTEKVAARRR